MTEISPRHQFQSPLRTLGGLRLQVRTTGRGGQLTPYLRGVPLGRPVNVGDEDVLVELEVERLPHVTLPAEIRVAWEDGSEASSPLAIISEAEAVALTGNGALEEVSATLQNGMVKGRALNRRNGVERPVILGRINGVLLRPVEVGPPSAHEGGGAIVTFTMPIEPSDFSAEGGVIELIHAPAMTTLWRTVLAPHQSEEAAAVETRRRLTETEQRLAGIAAQIETRLGQELRRQNQLIEDVVAYMLALIHDRANRSETPDDGDREQARRLIESASTVSGSADDETLAVVGPLSPFMGWGWSVPELNRDRIELRRMQTAATVLNPHPERKVERIALTVLEGSTVVLSQLSAQTDGQTRKIQASEELGAPFTASLVLTPPLSVGLLSLAAPMSQEGLAVQDVRFFYVRDL
ncbi:hypothetical protein [Brevundimonas sp.]|uniref:hypothetical protein n=1 Tax=Brevundimonas sp. TaxID=1871086 RepID=UPI0025BF4B4C|nr:hypothetical protein [Brevundimonas sp.]